MLLPLQGATSVLSSSLIITGELKKIMPICCMRMCQDLLAGVFFSEMEKHYLARGLEELLLLLLLSLYLSLSVSLSLSSSDPSRHACIFQGRPVHTRDLILLKRESAGRQCATTLQTFVYLLFSQARRAKRLLGSSTHIWFL